MNQEKLKKVLVSLGLAELDAEIYLFIVKNDLIKAADLTKTLKISKQRLYRVIKKMQRKGIISVTLEHPARFSALPFEKMLDVFAKAKMDEAQRIQQNKDDILSDWKSIGIIESERSPDKFTVIEGRSYVYSKIQQMIQETKSHLSFVATVPSFSRADVFGIFDTALNHPDQTKIRFRFLTELSEQNVKSIKTLLQKKPKAGLSFEGKTPHLGLKLCPRMVIRDEEETVFFLDNKKGAFSSEQDDKCLWTNSKSLVSSFSAMFEDLWRNSTDIQEKILQIETGKPFSETLGTQDATLAHTKHVSTMLSAEREIVIITSSKSLFSLSKNKTYSQKWVERGVSIKIMAPITSKNLKAAKQLSQFFEVKHVPQSYLETTIVDGKHLFQFKQPSSAGEKSKKNPYFIDTFYTDDLEQVEKMTNSINDIWKNAQPLSSVSPESSKPFGPMPPPLSKNHWKAMKRVTVIEEKPMINRKEILDKIIDHKTLNGETLMYATGALAIVHPPDNLNLPDVMFQINQIEKKSIFGRGDSLLIYLWLNTPEGYSFVPAGGIGDNPEGVAYRRKIFFTESPAMQCYRLVKIDELQIRVYGNSLFCGWTVPIQLYPTNYVLPPACLLVEGYGKIKTKAFSIILPSGFKSSLEYNYLDAFVTFMYPTTKYSGPGTDGAFIRDLFTTTNPPKNN